MINEAITKLMSAENLTYDESKSAIDEIMSGNASPVAISSFLTALAIKGETDEEIAGAADGMRGKASHLNAHGDVLDIVGTGGDKSNSFNISTTAAIVAAAAGVKVAKHGNRAASSKCGTADCFEALGVKIDADTSVMEKALDECNICFLFAQKYHSAMKYVGPVRKELGIRTVFNVLGPLTNPANAAQMVLGVFSEEYVEKIANALVKVGVKNAMVVYGKDGLDEISACGKTEVAEVRNGTVKRYTVKPEDFGFASCKKEDLVGGTPQENAKITLNVLNGVSTSAQRTATLLNAGAGIYASTPDITIDDAMKKAAEVVDNGKALETLKKFIEITNE